MSKKLLGLQTLLIGAGVIYSWSQVVLQFQKFYFLYGTIFRIKDCSYPNPLVTACFYGAVAFAVAFIWSLNLYLAKEPNQKSEKYLRNFLLFGACFAASVLTYEFLLFYKVFRPAGPIIACSPGVFPLKTPCFVGFNIFLLSFLLSLFIIKKSKLVTPTNSAEQLASK